MSLSPSLKYMLHVCLLLCSTLGCDQHTPSMTAEELIAHWGESKSGDEQVVSAILKSIDGVRDHDMNERLLECILQKLKSRPHLLKQLFYGFRTGRPSPPCDHDSWFIELLIRDMRANSSETPNKALFILLLSSMFDNSEWLDNLNRNIIDELLHNVHSLVGAHKYYVVFDHDLQKYVVSKAAIESGNRVSGFCQSWSQCEPFVPEEM